MTPLAIVSGATGGIGSVVVRTLWEAGYSVLCLGRNLGRLEGHARWCIHHPREGQDWYTLGFDVCCSEDYWRLHTLLEAQPHPVTLLAVCHGASPRPGPAEQDTTLKDARMVWETDVLGTYRLACAVWRYMPRGDGGSMVFVASAHARATYPGRLPYSLAKASVVAMARGLALEWGKYGIRINSISPWQVSGERTNVFIEKERENTGRDLLELYLQRSPLRRIVSPEDIAKTVLFLAENNSMSGADVILDCGLSSSMWYSGFMENT